MTLVLSLAKRGGGAVTFVSGALMASISKCAELGFCKIGFRTRPLDLRTSCEALSFSFSVRSGGQPIPFIVNSFFKNFRN